MISKYESKECANCGKLHVCTGTVHCPCFDVEVSEEILDYISTHFDECLCNECMLEIKKSQNQNFQNSVHLPKQGNGAYLKITISIHSHFCYGSVSLTF